MLTLTENASTVVKTIVGQSVEQPTDQETAGLRISQDAPDSPALHVIATEAPQPGDQVLEEDGARVFLEETAAATLDDKVLDAQVDEGGGVQFSIGIQATDQTADNTCAGWPRHGVRGRPAGRTRRRGTRRGRWRSLDRLEAETLGYGSAAARRALLTRLLAVAVTIARGARVAARRSRGVRRAGARFLPGSGVDVPAVFFGR